eukprot:scpid104249/ scgid24858/ 
MTERMYSTTAAQAGRNIRVNVSDNGSANGSVNGSVNGSANGSVDIIPETGSYSDADLAIDAAVCAACFTAGVLALHVLRSKRGEACLLDYVVGAYCLVCITSVPFYLPVVSAKHYLNITSVPQASIPFRANLAIMTVINLVQFVCVIFIATIRFVSLVKPLYYNRKVAFSNRLLRLFVIINTVGALCILVGLFAG